MMEDNIKTGLKVVDCEEGFDVLTAMTVTSTVFWDMTSCSLVEVYRHFGGTYYVHFEGIRRLEPRIKQRQCVPSKRR
jgi:hypothetical protein